MATTVYGGGGGGLSDGGTVDAGNSITFPTGGSAAAPSLVFGDGDSGIYEAADDWFRFSLGGTDRFAMKTTQFGTNALNGGGINIVVSSSTTPPFIPNQNDSNSGFSWQAEDNPCIVSGGLESARFEDPADLAAAETSLWVYDLDNAAIQQVTVGAADSGGSGFKVLRIVN